jgi:carbon storage regulator
VLVLTRKKDERIIINDNITIIIVDIQREKVRVGIEAPKEVPVHRQEVYEAIKRQEQQNGPASGEHGQSEEAGGSKENDPN